MGGCGTQKHSLMFSSLFLSLKDLELDGTSMAPHASNSPCGSSCFPSSCLYSSVNTKHCTRSLPHLLYFLYLSLSNSLFLFTSLILPILLSFPLTLSPRLFALPFATSRASMHAKLGILTIQKQEQDMGCCKKSVKVERKQCSL